jgi:hypothetical protein
MDKTEQTDDRVPPAAPATREARRVSLRRLTYVAPVVTTYLVGQAAAQAPQAPPVPPINPGHGRVSPKPKGPKK